MIPLLEVLFIRPALFVGIETRRCEGRGDTFDFMVGMRSSFYWCRLHLNYKPRYLPDLRKNPLILNFGTDLAIKTTNL